jgi:aminopeptidase pepS
MNQDLLKKYAALVIRVGVNLQHNQPLVIHAPIGCADFVHALASEAYDVGAYDVAVNWNDEELSHIRFQKAASERFKEFPAWRKDFYDDHAARGAAFISIAASDPDLYADIDPKRLTEASQTAGKALMDYRARLMSNKNTWCVVSVPTTAWARKVFPHRSDDDAVQCLWAEILHAVRVSEEEDAVSAWHAHIKRLQKITAFLNNRSFVELHYHSSLGTDLRIELPKGHIWMGGAEKSAEGTLFAANLPTEEVYTLPKRNGVNGIVFASKPLHYNGNLIRDFMLRFHEGKVVEYKAAHGENHLKELLGTDEGASFLGEVALVPHDSPISQSGILFYNTLFDENASCHLALGKAYPTCIENGESMTKEELCQHGVNHSLVHEDFMIGTPDLSVVGRTDSGEVVTIMENGNFTF